MLASPTNTSTPSTPTVATTNTLTVAYGLTGYCSPNVPNIGPLPSYLPAQQFGGPPDFCYPPMHPQYSAQIGPTQHVQPTDTSGQTTILPHAFATTPTRTLHDPTTSDWNMDTGDLYPVTAPSLISHAFLVSQHTWHQPWKTREASVCYLQYCD
ncbi:hypothetical protein Tco_0086431 [Tanacetum coccineum]